MDAGQGVQGNAEQMPATDASAPVAGFIDNATALWGDLKGLAHDHLELAALETRRAGESLVWIIAYGIIVGILGVSAWMGLVAAFVLWLVAVGLAPGAAVLIAVFINLVGAAVFVFLIKRVSRALRFPATVGALKPGGHPPVHPEGAQ